MDQADADYYRSAARNLRYHFSKGNKVMGSNLTETVALLCESAADALESKAQGTRETDQTGESHG